VGRLFFFFFFKFSSWRFPEKQTESEMVEREKREELPTAWKAVGEEFKKLMRSETTELASSLAMASTDFKVYSCFV
jgi:hypothetical protein